VVDLLAAFGATFTLFEQLLQKGIKWFAKAGFEQSLDRLQRAVKSGFPLQERQQAVGDGPDEDLAFHGLAAGAVEMFDPATPEGHQG